jgi:hypothetical protein
METAEPYKPRGYLTFEAEHAKLFTVKDRSIKPMDSTNAPLKAGMRNPPQVEPSELEETITGGGNDDCDCDDEDFDEGDYE